MTVRYFAHARRASGLSSETIDLAGPLTSSEFWDQLIRRHPDLASLRASSRLARNNEFLPASARIETNDEIAVIPPVSGG